MSRVVVVGAGAGGLAAAARLARLRHDVTVVEQEATVGGRWRTTERDGFLFTAQPAEIRLPAALRDLFLKTGRRFEDAVALSPGPTATAHVFPDGTRLTQPTGGEEWERFVSYGQRVWEAGRTPLLESPATRAQLRSAAIRHPRRAGLLAPRRPLRRITRRITDPRLRAVAAHYGARAGWSPQTAPATAATLPYVEQSFLVWSVAGGPGSIVAAIHQRAVAQGAVVMTDTRVVEICTAGGRVAGVRLDDGRSLTADIVVDDTGTAAATSREILVGLRGRTIDRPTRVVLHGEPTIDVHIDPDEAADRESLTATLPLRDPASLDQVLARLTSYDAAVRHRVVVTAERTSTMNEPASGWLPQPAPTTETDGLFTVGRSAAFGRDLAFVVMSAAAVAELVGRA